MSDNVIILGAGFSYDANIPLINNFVEIMWDFAIRKTHNRSKLSFSDLEIFEKAIKVRNELDGYHGRSAFDDRNIEDILSILTFNVLGGNSTDKKKLKDMNRAITRTIELMCNIKQDWEPNGRRQINQEGPDVYKRFWKSLFSWKNSGRKIPTIITFNYDLVLERSLVQLLVGTNFNNRKKIKPFSSFELKYSYDFIPKIEYEVENVNWNSVSAMLEPGTNICALKKDKLIDHQIIEILKLHGSLNFPSKYDQKQDLNFNFTKVLDNPYILPPIFNKMDSSKSDTIWQAALQRIRSAKNIIIVGYSLPQTDIYMQYFLKAALGPNVNFNKMFVFNPALFDSENSVELRSRYENCFSDQMRKRIEFFPNIYSGNYQRGTTRHFIGLLEESPDEILF